MEAKELRIGNYVYDPINKENVKLVAIEQGNRPITLGSKGTSSFSGFDCLQPIPLTEEWKINFGVVKRGVEWRFNLGESSICFEETPEGFFYTGGEGVNLSRNIEFVHDFQNIVYAIEGIEIQINQSAK